jgi:hypothetical protein
MSGEVNYDYEDSEGGRMINFSITDGKAMVSTTGSVVRIGQATRQITGSVSQTDDAALSVKSPLINLITGQQIEVNGVGLETDIKTAMTHLGSIMRRFQKQYDAEAAGE